MSQTRKSAETRRKQTMEVSGSSVLIKLVVLLLTKPHTYSLCLILSSIAVGTFYKCLGQQPPNTDSGLDTDPTSPETTYRTIMGQQISSRHQDLWFWSYPLLSPEISLYTLATYKSVLQFNPCKVQKEWGYKGWTWACKTEKRMSPNVR